MCKSWPTREEIDEAESGNAGVHLWNMKRDSPEEYADMLETRNIPWGGQPRQHISYCVDHLCWLLIITCQQANGDGTLSSKDVEGFMKATA